MNDLKLRQDILDEIELDLNESAAHVGVSVEDGVVTLTGHVGSDLEEAAVIQAVRRVNGIRAIAQELQIHSSDDAPIQDDEIAALVIKALERCSVPHELIRISVRAGLVTLSGEIHQHYQRKAAERCIRKLAGVVGIINDIAVSSPTR